MVNIALAITAAALAALYALGIAVIPGMMISDAVGPRAYPTLLLIVLLVVGVMLAFEGIREKDWTSSRRAFSDFMRNEATTFIGSGISILAYFLLFEPLGYLISTALFLMISMVLLHRGRRWIAIVVAIGFTLATHVLFVDIFGTQLPAGLLSF